MIETNNFYEFSYDNEEDALDSLSKYYEIKKDVIFANLNEINDLIKEKIELEDKDVGKYAWLIRKLLIDKKENNYLKLRVNYYHHCGSDGTLEWFKEGLLNNFDGLTCFLSKIEELFPMFLNDHLKTELRQRMEIRFQGEAFGKKAVGVYAYSRFQEAKSRNAYDFPEIFSDIGNIEMRNKIKLFLKEKLKPTVVKFYVDLPSNDLDEILFNYWYLICQKFDEDIMSNSYDIGKGNTIPFNQIKQIHMVT